MKKTITLILAIAFNGAGAVVPAIGAPAAPDLDFALPAAGLGQVRGLARGELPVPVPVKAAGARAKGLADVAYTFNKAKLAAAKDSFHFLRSYVDYFYLLAKANRGSLQAVSAADSVQGWCVGDAHPENFGALIRNDGSSLFTMNDMDDSGPCPVVLDLYRLMASSRLYDQNTKLDKLVKAYTDGLQGRAYDVPAPVTDMLAKSQRKGTAPDPKKISGNRLVRGGNMYELNSGELAQLKTALAAMSAALSPRVKLLDAVSTSKTGGGSGGLLRYEVLLDNGGALLHLEFKEEATPSIYPVASGQVPAAPQRAITTLRMEQGAGASAFYNVVAMAGKYMFVRPRFDGNVGMSLARQNDKDNKDIIRYEAYILGQIHARSVRNSGDLVRRVQAIPSSAWENDVALMTAQFDLKFSQLKN